MDGPALLILEREPGDPRSPARMAAVRARLEEAGVTVLPDLVHTRKDLRARLSTAIRDGDPRPRMIFADDDDILMAAAMVDPGRTLKTSYLVAGFVSDSKNADLANYGQAAAVVDRRVPEPAIRAVDVALALAAGRAVSGPIVIPTPVRVATGPPKPGFLPMQAASTPQFSGTSITPK